MVQVDFLSGTEYKIQKFFVKKILKTLFRNIERGSYLLREHNSETNIFHQLWLIIVKYYIYININFALMYISQERF